MFKKNLEKLKQDLIKNNIDLAVITDDDSIYYFTGYYDFLHMSFGRPTLLLVPKDADTLLITPLIDAHLVKENCPVDKIITWNDGVDNEWREDEWKLHDDVFKTALNIVVETTAWRDDPNSFFGDTKQHEHNYFLSEKTYKNFWYGLPYLHLEIYTALNCHIYFIVRVTALS